MKPTRLAATVFFAALTTASLAQNTAVDSPNPRAINRIEHRLNITPQQLEQARAIFVQEAPALEKMHLALAAERKDMASTFVNGSFDTDAAQAVAARYAEVNASAVVERAKLSGELLAILTPEQKDKLQQLHARIAALLAAQLPGIGDTL
jgi:Spy/CpxP family protein refolding chaperone